MSLCPFPMTITITPRATPKQSIFVDSPSGIVANVLNCSIIVSEFEVLFSFYIHSWMNLFVKDMNLAQSAGAVECTDCTSAEGKDPPSTSVLDMTLNNLMVRFGECGVPLHCHCSQVHCGPEW